MFAICCAVPLALAGFGALYAWLNRVPQTPITHLPLPAVNAFDVHAQALTNYVAWGAKTPLDAHLDPFVKEECHFGSPSYNRRYPPALKQVFLRRNARAFALFRKALTLPYVQPPERKGRRVAPHPQYREFARALLVEAHAHAQSESWDKAADSLMDILRFGHQTPRGGPFIASLSSIGSRAEALRDFHIVLPHISVAKSRECIRELEKLHASRITTAEALSEEKWAEQGIISYLTQTDGWVSVYGVSPQLSLFTKAQLRWMNKARLLRENARCLDWQIAQAKKPYVPDNFRRDAPWPFPTPYGGPETDQVKAIVYPQFTRSPLTFLLQETKESLFISLLALRAFKLEQGRYPTTLQELTPRYLSRVPLDPFSVKPLRYQLRPVRFITRQWMEVFLLPGQVALPDRPLSPEQVREHKSFGTMPFALYSVGFDARDDGGIPWSDLQNATGKLRHRANLKMFDAFLNGQKADIVAGINL